MGRRGSLLVDGGLEDKRMFLTDAGLLADPLHSPPSAEAEHTSIKVILLAYDYDY